MAGQRLGDRLMYASVFPAALQRPSIAPQQVVPDTHTPGGGTGLSREAVENVRDVAINGGTILPANQDEQSAFAETLTSNLREFLKDASVTASRPAHVDPNYWSQPIDLSGSVSIAAGAFAANVWTTIVTYVIPAGNWGRIASYGVNVRDPAYTYDGSLLWRMAIDGQPVPSIESFAQQRGTLAQPRQCYVIAKQDQRVSLQVRRQVGAGAAQTVEGCFVGWRWQPRNAYDNAQNTRTL